MDSASFHCGRVAGAHLENLWTNLLLYGELVTEFTIRILIFVIFLRDWITISWTAGQSPRTVANAILIEPKIRFE